MSQGDSTAGRATAQGTRRFADRFASLDGHFRTPDRLTFSSLALGMRNGEVGGIDDMLYRSAVGSLLEQGVNVFVTALSDRMYSSERCLGSSLARAFHEASVQRDEVIVVTKGGYLSVDPDRITTRAQSRRYLTETYVETGLVDPDRVVHGVHCIDGPFLRDQIERSRRNLQLETIDLYLVEEPEIHIGECSAQEFAGRMRTAFEALERAVADRVIGAYGLATWDGFLRPHTDRGHLALLDVFDWALEVGGGDHHLRAVQLPYSVAMAEAFRLDSQIAPTGHTGAVLETLRGTGTAVLASAPLVQGRALGRLPAVLSETFPDLVSDAQRCLQFVRSTPQITSAVTGMRDPDHVDENAAIGAHPPADRERLEGLFKRATAR